MGEVATSSEFTEAHDALHENALDSIMGRLETYYSGDRGDEAKVAEIQTIRKLLAEQSLSATEIPANHLSDVKRFITSEYGHRTPEQLVDTIKNYLELINKQS